ncbi:MAG: hypothetical protein PHG66_06825 [Candidatus Colwellbacteria bacterium]|nr:hypothetical protein [Candidatus Colwellbacteria bacterium]
MAAAIDWEEVAKEYGFRNVQTMFNKLYIRQKKNVADIARIIKITPPVILAALRKYGFAIRRGNGNQKGFYICKYCKKKFEGDIRNVCCPSKKCQTKREQDIKEIVRIRQKKRGDRMKKKKVNGCIVCGKDKGKNMFYCKACHSIVSNGSLFEI